MKPSLFRWLSRRRSRDAVVLPMPGVRVPEATPTPTPAPVQSGLPVDLVGLLEARLAPLAPRFAERDAADAAAVFADLATAGVAGIRQLPAAAQDALAATREPDPSVFSLAATCRKDPTLIAALLRTANSPFYGSGERIEAIPAAIKRVGIEGLRSVLLAHALEGMLCRPGPRYEPLVTAVWSHMVRTAPLARALAPALGARPESAFTLGLLHDAGKLVLLDRLAAFRQAQRRIANVPAPLLSAVLRDLHEPLGGLAAIHWGLSSEAAQVVARHHEPPLVEDPMTRTVALAERVDIGWVRGMPLDLPAVWAAWGLAGEPPELSAY